MGYIKSIYIDGFKKFNNFTMNFNEDLNVLVGENEAGKSTILEALMIVLNQNYKNLEKTLLAPLFNLDRIEKYKNEPRMENLPKIYIEVELDLNNHPANRKFYGEINLSKKEKTGISFCCKFDETFKDILKDTMSSTGETNNDVPFEFYSLSWKTFQGSAYNNKLNPFNLLFIDTSEGSAASAFYNYSRSLFLNKFKDSRLLIGKNSFRRNVDEAFSRTELDKFDDNDKFFRLNHQKLILENIISIYHSGIALENKGGGMRNLIKTTLAISKNSDTNLIFMEEPEIHLSHTNLLHMLNLIKKGNDNNTRQLIVTTHNDLIATHLGLRKVIWINDCKGKSLEDIKPDTADFFAKASDNNFLKFLLSKKVILVEGPTESLMIPYLYNQEYGRSLEDDNITIITCNGVKYKRYKEIDVMKKVAALIDNDKDNDRVIDILNEQNENLNFKVFTSQNIIDEYTWELCFYKINNDKIDEYFKSEDVQFAKKDEEDVVGKMLKNKVEAAFLLVNSGLSFNIPDYVLKAFEWIRK